MIPELIVRDIGLQDYAHVWQAMKTFTDSRTPETCDEIWLLEHHPVFTLGQNGKPEHVLNAQNIPLLQVDRGGQVTYHGPGQLVVYFMLDLRRKNVGVRQLVTAIEQGVVASLAEYDIQAAPKAEAPGVYVDGAKIASIGLRIRRGYSYHGLAFNVDMDLTPFTQINPCGYKDLTMVQCRDLGGPENLSAAKVHFIKHFTQLLGYNPTTTLATTAWDN